MTPEENKRVVLRALEALENGDEDEWVACWAPEATNHGRPVNRESVRLLFQSLRTAFPDRHHEIRDLRCDGDTVVTRIMASGTFGTIPPIPVENVDFADETATDKPYSVHSIHMWRIRDALVAEHWAVRDDLALLIQLGAIEVPAKRADRS